MAGITFGGESDEVADILIELMQRETMNYSAEFANLVVAKSSPFIRFRSNNHRFAGFRVLTAPDVPSILLETGYMSNENDSRFLFSSAGQTAVAKGVTKAIEGYFDRRAASAARTVN